LKATHQADVDCLKDEHEKNLKNLAQEFKDKVYNVSVLTVFIFQFSVFSFNCVLIMTRFAVHFVSFMPVI